MSATTSKPTARPTTSTPKTLKTKEIDEIIGRPHFSYKDEIRDLQKLYTFDGFEKHISAHLKDIPFLKNDIVRTWNLLIKLPNKTTNFRKITFQELNLTNSITNRPLNDEKIKDAYNMVNYIISVFIDDHYYCLKQFENGFLLWMDDKINHHVCDKIYPLYYPNINYYGIKDVRGGLPNHKESSYGNYRYTSHPHYNSKHKKDFTVPDYSGRKVVDSNERYLGRDMTSEISRQSLAANISEINAHLNKEDSKKSGKKKKKKKNTDSSSKSSFLDKAKDAIDDFFKGNDRNSYRETSTTNTRTIRFFFGMKTKPFVTVYKDYNIKETLLSNEFMNDLYENKSTICKLLEHLYGMGESNSHNKYEDLTSQIDPEKDMVDFIIHLTHYMEAVKSAVAYEYFPAYLMNAFLYQKGLRENKKKEIIAASGVTSIIKPLIDTKDIFKDYIDLYVQVNPLGSSEIVSARILNTSNKELAKNNIAVIERIVQKCIGHYYNGNFQKEQCSYLSVDRLINEVVNSKYLDFFIRAQDVPTALYDMIKPRV